MTWEPVRENLNFKRGIEPSDAMGTNFSNIFPIRCGRVTINWDKEKEACYVFYPFHGWDSYKKAIQDIQYLAKHENDPMEEDLFICLEEYGLEIDTSVEMKIESGYEDGDQGSYVYFKIKSKS